MILLLLFYTLWAHTPEITCFNIINKLTTSPIHLMEKGQLRYSQYDYIPLIERMPEKVTVTQEWRELLQKKFPTPSWGEAAQAMGMKPSVLKNLYEKTQTMDRVTIVKVSKYFGIPDEVCLRLPNASFSPKAPIKPGPMFFPRRGEGKPKWVIVPQGQQVPQVKLAPQPLKSQWNIHSEPQPIVEEKPKVEEKPRVRPIEEKPKKVLPIKTPIPVKPLPQVTDSPHKEMVVKNQHTPYLLAVILDPDGSAKSFRDFERKLLALPKGIDVFLDEVELAAKQAPYEEKLFVLQDRKIDLLIQINCYLVKKGFKPTLKPSSKIFKLIVSEEMQDKFMLYFQSMVSQRLQHPFKLDLD